MPRILMDSHACVPCFEFLVSDCKNEKKQEPETRNPEHNPRNPSGFMGLHLVGLVCSSLFLTLALVGVEVHAQSASFDALLEQELAKEEAPGFSVAVLHEGDVIYMNAVGYADVKKEVPVTPSTRFMIGSVTKQFTAMAVLMLVEEGLVDLDENVQTYLPELASAYDAVTVRHLLTHTSGIKSDFKKRSSPPFYNESLLGDDLYKALSEADLEFMPGDALRYSNTGFSLLYMIIETVSGSTYSAFLQSRIFDPLEMTATQSRDHSNSEIDGLANGYVKPRRKFQPVGSVLRLGGGSLVSTVEDLAKWDAALYTEKLVSKSTLDESWTPYVLNDGKNATMGVDPQGRYYQAGMGWFIGDEKERGLVHHSGGIDGYAANIDRYREEGLTVIVLCNIENATALLLTAALAENYFTQQ